MNLTPSFPPSGLQRVDHVVLGVQTDRLCAGENIFAVQGGLQDADNRIAHMRSAEAMTVPSAQMIALAKDAPFPVREPEAMKLGTSSMRLQASAPGRT